jgi:hypothetical protein
MIHAISESNQNWYVNYHKRNHNGINRLITGSVGLVQRLLLPIGGRQNRLTFNEIIT